MPVRTGLVVSVKEHPQFSRRVNVWIHEGGPGGMNTPLFTMEPRELRLMASFCERQSLKGQRVTVWTMDTQYGERIVKVDEARAEVA